MPDEPEPVELVLHDTNVTAEFISDEGLALTWSQSGHIRDPIAIPLAEGKEALDRPFVESQLRLQIPTEVVSRLMALIDTQYPDAFDPEAPN